MGRKKGYNIIDEAHERANNNINPYYWFNRVTPYTIARMKAAKKAFSGFYFAIFTLIVVGGFYELHVNAVENGQTLARYIFDFSDANTSSRFVSLALPFFLWVVYGIGTVQNIIARLATPPTNPAPKPKKAKKKKHPKHRKDYK